MNRFSRLAFLSAICLVTNSAFACRYNVRDVGFVNLGVDTCMLFGLVDAQTPPADVASIRTVISEKLEHTDLKAEMINVTDDPDHPAARSAATHAVTSLPAALLVAPDSRSHPVSFAGASLRSRLASELDALLSSPVREQIVQACVAGYGAILVVEGAHGDQNSAAERAARGAASLIAEHLAYLPKPVAKGPEVITLTRESFKHEELLLWFLDLQAEEVLQPQAAVFYGRARRIGPVLAGHEITENTIANILALIGADCECGLDRRWMEGPMLPVRWPPQTRARIAESLGFDPDSPTVKMEVSMILRKNPGSHAQADLPGFDGVPFGYQEIVIDFDDANTQPAEPSAVVSAPEEPLQQLLKTRLQPENTSIFDAHADETLSLAVTLGVVTVFGAAVVVIGIVILRRGHIKIERNPW